MRRWLRVGLVVVLLLFASLYSASPAWTHFADGVCPSCFVQSAVFEVKYATLYVSSRTNTFAAVGVFTLAIADPGGTGTALRSFQDSPFGVTITVGSVGLTYTFQQVAPQTYIAFGPQGGQGWAVIYPLGSIPGPVAYGFSFSATGVTGLPSPGTQNVNVALTFLPANATLTKSVSPIFLP